MANKVKVRVVRRWTVAVVEQRRHEEARTTQQPRERVLFNGSARAFEIWRAAHQIPADAEVVYSGGEG